MSVMVFELATQKVDFFKTIFEMLLVFAGLFELFSFCIFSSEVSWKVIKKKSYLEKFYQRNDLTNFNKFKGVEIVDHLYFTNWLTLTLESRRAILIMMIRSGRPIIIRCGPLIEFTNESSLKVSNF